MFIKKVLKKIFTNYFHGKNVIQELENRGVTIGENVEIINSNIDYGHGFLLTIGDNVTITHSTILTHDASTKKKMGYSKVGKVTIGNNVFIGMGSIILPNTTIGNDVIIGAGSVVTKDIPNNSVVAGNPAKKICSYNDYIENQKKIFINAPKYETYWKVKSELEKEKMKNDLEGIIGFDK